MLFLIESVKADANTSKDWFWDSTNSTYATALTMNENNYVLGLWCYHADDNCIYIIDFGLTCEKLEEYPVLINSNIGTSHMNVTCGHEYEGHNVMYASDYDQIDSIVKNASKIGFAIPLKGDEFKAVRFSLAGSNYAIDKMLTEFLAISEGSNNSEGVQKAVNSEEYF